MTELLDIDEPAEVIAAAGRVTAASAAVTSHVNAVIGALVPAGEASSELDRVLIEALRSSLASAFGSATAAHDVRSATIYTDTTQAVSELAAAEEDAGRAIAGPSGDSS
ncbi:hypothetical protein ACFXG7_35910 [Nocardia tengchongensis]|uniref:hypothetical protein n=2 Tax=Nocardia tengchongensis TaxID=2055889 RepID=UPI0036A16296